MQSLRIRIVPALLPFSLFLVAAAANANNTPQPLPFTQDWSNTGLITTDGDWSAVPGIIGYRGDNLTGLIGADPQTILADGSVTPVSVLANNTNPSATTSGAVYEFEIADPTIGVNGSGTADAPHIVLHLNTTNKFGIFVRYNLRDVDGSADDAAQPFALQFRVGGTGDYTNVGAGFVADATTGGSATQFTSVFASLPVSADNQALVEVRIMTANAGGNDEATGIDDIEVTFKTPVELQTFTID